MRYLIIKNRSQKATVTNINSNSVSNSFILNDSQIDNQKSHSNGKMSSKISMHKI